MATCWAIMLSDLDANFDQILCFNTFKDWIRIMLFPEIMNLVMIRIVNNMSDDDENQKILVWHRFYEESHPASVS